MESLITLIGLLIQIVFYIAILLIIWAILLSPIIILIIGIKNRKKKTQNTEYKRYEGNENAYPYKKKRLLTQTEYHFYMILKEECDERDLLICPKVRMEDYIDVTTKKEKQRYRGYIKSRHIDFLICDKELNIIAGLELDDKSHNNINAQKTDALKNDIYKNINIPLMRINVTSGRYREQIINILNYLVNQK